MVDLDRFVILSFIFSFTVFGISFAYSSSGEIFSKVASVVVAAVIATAAVATFRVLTFVNIMLVSGIIHHPCVYSIPS